MAENVEKLELPALDCDILSGYDQIGAWQGITGGQARSRANAGLIPVHRPKGRNVVFAFKSEILAHMRALATKSRKVSEEPTPCPLQSNGLSNHLLEVRND